VSTEQESVRGRRVARVIDREVAPIWHDRFARMILQRIPIVPGSFVLDVHCGAGRTTADLLQRLDDTSRVFAIEPDPAFIGLAKARVRPEWRDRVYFKQGDISSITGMGDATYDLTIANLVLGEAHDRLGVLSELVRVTKPGGYVFATLAMDGTWAEVEDLLGETLRDAGLKGAPMRRLERLRALRPTGRALADLMARLGVHDDDFVVEQERCAMLFPSGREFLFAPVVEHVPLRLWKAIIGQHGKPQELFWRLKEAIDAYYANHVFSVTMVAGLLQIQVANGEHRGHTLRTAHSRYHQEIDRIWRAEAVADTSDSDLEIDIDLDVEEEVEVAAASATAAAPAAAEEFEEEDREIFEALERVDAGIDQLLDDVFEFGEGDTVARRKEAPAKGSSRDEATSTRPPRPPSPDRAGRIASARHPPAVCPTPHHLTQKNLYARRRNEVATRPLRVRALGLRLQPRPVRRRRKGPGAHHRENTRANKGRRKGAAHRQGRHGLRRERADGDARLDQDLARHARCDRGTRCHRGRHRRGAHRGHHERVARAQRAFALQSRRGKDSRAQPGAARGASTCPRGERSDRWLL
jgi:SAM-dependent methyltransferase